mgnify:CR=1 FL=1
MRILALDLGTKTGWALWDGERIESGVQIFALERGESPGMRFLRFNAWLNQMSLGLELVAYEKPHHRGGAATEIACGFSTRVHELCARRRIEYASVHTATLKKFAVGRGNADKDMILEAAFQRWRNQFPQEEALHRGLDDQADALWVLEWARQRFDPAVGCKPHVSGAAHLGSC